MIGTSDGQQFSSQLDMLSAYYSNSEKPVTGSYSDAENSLASNEAVFDPFHNTTKNKDQDRVPQGPAVPGEQIPGSQPIIMSHS
jgi:hypothetical protein